MLLKILFLSVLQGIAEFLPISSSGHLVAAKTFLGIETEGVSLELALHAGTLLSICIYYIGMLRGLVLDLIAGKRGAWQYAGAIVLSMVPAGLAYAMVGDWLEEAFSDVRFVGPALMATGILLLTTRREKTADSAPVSEPSIAPVKALWMGVGQVVAMLPGVSRSGTTIWVARLCRVPATEAVRFSFLMSVPVIAGACALKGIKAFCCAEATEAAAASVPGWMLLVGGLVAAVVGYLSLRFLVRMLSRGYFWVFGVYCLLAGLLLVML